MKISALVKSIIILFLFALLLPFISSTVFAQTITPSTSNSVASTNPDVPDNLHNRTQAVMIETMSSLICQLAGIDPINPKQACLGADQKTGKIGFLPAENSAKVKMGGAIGELSQMISMLYTPPAHTMDYFQNLAQNFGIAKKTYAATTGTGFNSLSPIMNIWVAFRNIVYLLLVIVFVIIGLAIMLRVKIDPRTVMTIQNQIPKIIIGILAVTFSFAIAGFLIDMMWVLIYLSYSVFNGISADITRSIATLDPTTLQKSSVLSGSLGIGGILGAAWKISLDGLGSVQSLLGINTNPVLSIVPGLGIVNDMTNILKGTPSTMDTVIDLASFAFGVARFNTVMSWPVITAVGTGAGSIENLPVAILYFILYNAIAEAVLRWMLPFAIIFVVITFALFIALFRLWFSLLMAYVEILLSIVLAPFWIIGGIIPGSPISLGGWLRNLSANLLAFPVTIVMFMFASIFIYVFGNHPSPGYFVPPLIGDPGNPSLIGGLIGLGVILTTPNVVSLVKQMIKAPKTDMSGGVIKGLGAGAAVPMSGARATGAYFAKTPLMGQPGGIWGAIRNIGRF